MISSNIDYMNGIDIIYWINLEKCSDRKISMEEMFTNDCFKNANIERVNAVNGNEVNVFDYINTTRKQKSNAEYGCLLSHLNTIHTFSKSSYKYALIMEDDLTLDYQKYWKKSLKTVMDNAPMDWEVIQLCYITTTGIIPEREYELNNNRFVSAAAYIINKSAAKKLMNLVYDNVTHKYNIEGNRNHHADVYIFSKLKTYVYKFPYFIYKKNNYSTLHPSDLKEHSFSREIITDMYHSYYPAGIVTQPEYSNINFHLILFIFLLILLLIYFFSTKLYSSMKILNRISIWRYVYPR
jgi:GR25 family glycosyltransferase involved in LPS biosynthesis